MQNITELEILELYKEMLKQNTVKIVPKNQNDKKLYAYVQLVLKSDSNKQTYRSIIARSIEQSLTQNNKEKIGQLMMVIDSLIQSINNLQNDVQIIGDKYIETGILSPPYLTLQLTTKLVEDLMRQYNLTDLFEKVDPQSLKKKSFVKDKTLCLLHDLQRK
ncbi:Hypothetical_protein [Hexamita inflata]|uniref:Hypothetical_protein n=1 Tax=Hexamita inflata TaxID=28002 RepID=A0AA86UDA8_9EUKA|nr:Hypothetical protein HINF_LOCUS24903 [Hexamita inflata]